MCVQTSGDRLGVVWLRQQGWVCVPTSPLGSMADRKAFFQKLAQQRGVAKGKTLRAGGSGNGEDGEALNERRLFLGSLAPQASSSQCAAVSLVDFSMKKLREFKGTHLASTSFKVQPEATRKRPNYDSTKRKMFANPTQRVKYHN